MHSTAGLRGDMLDKTERKFELVVPASTSTAADVLLFAAAYVVGISAAYAVGGEEVADITIKPHKTVPTWSTRASVS